MAAKLINALHGQKLMLPKSNMDWLLVIH